jgi:cell division protein FtsZ
MEAAQQAISSPLLEEVSIRGARAILINISGGSDLTLHDVAETTSAIYEAAGEEAEVIFGAVNDPSITGELRVTVIATGFNHADAKPQPKPMANGKVFEPIRSMPADVRNFEPKVVRASDPITVQPLMRESNGHLEPVVVGDDFEVPAFLRRQMD